MHVHVSAQKYAQISYEHTINATDASFFSIQYIFKDIYIYRKEARIFLLIN